MSGIILIASIIIWNKTWNHTNKPTATTVRAASAQSAAAIKPTKPTTSADQMTSAINQVIAANTDVDISVTVLDLKTGSSTHYGVANDITFEAASISKLITAVAYLHGVEQGSYTLDQDINGQSAQANLQTMIVDSDNDAWQALNNTITHDTLQSYATTTLGFSDYDPDANTLTPDDIAHLEQKLYQQKLLNKSHTQLLLGYMAQANRTDFIKAAIPSGVAFYHKAGWLEDRDHDAAIIDDGNHPYILVIFTNGHDNTHQNDRTTVIQQITKATVAHFISSEAS